MTAALATIVFLSAAWFAIVAIAGSLEGGLARIASALRGEARPAIVPIQLRVSARYQPVRQPRARARVRYQHRAAA